ncbi:MAG: ribosome maturation factor RimM [Bacteroidia bacterium]|nr:ribosome maturation factor RimM [Bacteroidia bacterium]
MTELPLERLFLWGKVRRAHGLRGYVIAETFSEAPNRYNLSTFWICRGSVAVPHPVSHIAPLRSKNTRNIPLRWWYLRFQGVENRTEAERWVKAELYLPRDYLPPLLDDKQFYYVEAIGAQVADEQGKTRGTVRYIQMGTAYDFFIVENEANETFWIPAPFVKRINRTTLPFTLEVEGPDGIWDPSLAKGKP